MRPRDAVSLEVVLDQEVAGAARREQRGAFVGEAPIVDETGPLAPPRSSRGGRRLPCRGRRAAARATQPYGREPAAPAAQAPAPRAAAAPGRGPAPTSGRARRRRRGRREDRLERDDAPRRAVELDGNPTLPRARSAVTTGTVIAASSACRRGRRRTRRARRTLVPRRAPRLDRHARPRSGSPRSPRRRRPEAAAAPRRSARREPRPGCGPGSAGRGRDARQEVRGVLASLAEPLVAEAEVRARLLDDLPLDPHVEDVPSQEIPVP